MKSYKSSSTFIRVDLLFHELLPFLQYSVCHASFPHFSCLCFHISRWKLVPSFYMKSYRSSSTFVAVDLLFHVLLPFLQNSVPHTSFPDFSLLYFYISGWKLVASFYIKSYRVTFVTVDLLFHGLQIWICWGRWGTCIALAILTICLFYTKIIETEFDSHVSLYRLAIVWNSQTKIIVLSIVIKIKLKENI